MGWPNPMQLAVSLISTNWTWNCLQRYLRARCLAYCDDDGHQWGWNNLPGFVSTHYCGTQVDEAESKVHEGDRSIILVLAKKDKDAEHWPRLLKASGKAPNNIKVCTP